MTLIKLCGMMTEDDIAEANRLRPDMIGFIFVPNSRRYVPSEKAYKLRRKLDRRIKAAGVFVNEEPEKISRAVKDGIIDLIQLHGDEDDAYIRALREETDTKIIKAFRIRNRNDVMDTLRSSADMILFDPRHLKSCPNHDAEATVVYASSEENIDTTIVNGKIVYHKGTFSGGLDEAELIREIAVEVEKMKASL